MLYLDQQARGVHALAPARADAAHPPHGVASAAVPRPLFWRCAVIGAAASLAIEAAALEAWLAGAETGDRLVYATGPVLPWAAESVRLARALAEDGLIRTHLVRVGDSFEYFAVKRQPDPDAPPPVRPVAPRGEDDADARVLRALCRAANLGQVCPSNAELAQGCGLSDALAASYRLRKLVQAGSIRVEDQGPSKRRIVTIVATGQRTVPGAL